MIHQQIQPSFCWEDYDTVLLDMDGTLLDKNFDDTFWGTYVPKKYGERLGLSPEEGHRQAFKHFHAASGSLDWTDIDYWSRTFGLNIFELQLELIHLVKELPGTIEFLRFLQGLQKEIILVTNSHSKGLALKFDVTCIEEYFSKVTCATELGASKEEAHFWQNYEKHFSLNKKRTLFIDDNHRVLDIAHAHGLTNLVAIAQPSSQLSCSYSNKYPSVARINELIF